MLDSVELSLSSCESSEHESSEDASLDEDEEEPDDEDLLLEWLDDAPDEEQEQDSDEEDLSLLDEDEDENKLQLHEDEDDDEEDDDESPNLQDLLSRPLISSGLKNPSPISAAHVTPITAHKSSAVFILETKLIQFLWAPIS